jgi:hydroxymethylpyrimidine/phosphomethylpyrimidine kinase
MPLATVVTPNLAEASRLIHRPVETVVDMERAARELHRPGQVVVVKGGHLPGDPVDVVWDGSTLHHLKGERVVGRVMRGTGCRLATAIAVGLARGEAKLAAIRAAKDKVTQN